MPGIANSDLPTDLDCDLRGQREAEPTTTNVMVALVGALQRPEHYDLRERNGELFVTPKVLPKLTSH